MENQNTRRNFSHEDMSKINIIQELSDDDLKKILFLLIDSKDLRNYESLISQNEKLKEKLQNMYTQCNLGLIHETLYAIKKYSLLRRFNSCKHQSDSNSHGYIEKFRKFLFSICEELTDDDVSYVGKELLELGETQFISAESLMCRLLVKDIISAGNLSNLIKIFEKEPAKYSDLVEMCNTFCGSEKSESSLSISSAESSSSESDDELMVYPVKFSVKSKKCGVAVILNQVKFKRFSTRNGSNADRDKLVQIWKKYGFRVIVKENMESDAIRVLFQSLASEEYEKPSIFVACILSHGDEGDIIFGSDDKPVTVHSLVDMIANNCKSLYGMPKVFFIQACKGKVAQEALVLDNPNSNHFDGDEYCFDAQRYIARMCDTFVAYATVEGFASLRSRQKGSIFIQKLTECLEKYGEKEDIGVIMKRVTRSISALKPKVKGTEKISKQMPECRSTLCGNLIFKKF